MAFNFLLVKPWLQNQPHRSRLVYVATRESVFYPSRAMHLHILWSRFSKWNYTFYRKRKAIYIRIKYKEMILVFLTTPASVTIKGLFSPSQLRFSPDLWILRIKLGRPTCSGCSGRMSSTAVGQEPLLIRLLPGRVPLTADWHPATRTQKHLVWNNGELSQRKDA